MSFVKSFEKRIETGRRILEQISSYHPSVIKAGLEKIYEIYKHNLDHQELAQEYEKAREFSIVYSFDMTISSAKLYWSFYDTARIEIGTLGITFKYKPEHGSEVKIAELPWEVVNIQLFESENV